MPAMPSDPAAIEEILLKAKDAYYNTSSPILSDAEYDKLEDELRKLDPKSKFFEKVGSPSYGEKAKLPFYMASLDKIKETKEIQRFLKDQRSFVASWKLDGISAAAASQNGEPWKLYTRGEAEIGRDISSIAKSLRLPPPPEEGAMVRGEIIMPLKAFEKYSLLFANPRNLCAGVVNQKEPDEIILKDMEFIAYELISPWGFDPAEQFCFLKELGFKIAPYTVSFRKGGREWEYDSQHFSDLLEKAKKKAEWEIDGLVLTWNRKNKREHGKNPSYSAAFKSEALNEKASAVVKEIEWNISKHGILKPVAVFENPSKLDGAVVSRASAHNARFVFENKIGPGAVVALIRSGAVIPKIVSVEKPCEKPSAGMPSGEYKWHPDPIAGPDIIPAEEALEEQIPQWSLKEIEAFFKILKVENLGPGILKKLSAAGLDTWAKIIEARESDLMKAEGIKEKAAKKIRESISSKMKNIPFPRLLHAFNCFGPLFGEKRIAAILEMDPGILQRGEADSSIPLPKGVSKKTLDEFCRGIPDAEKALKDLPKLVEWIIPSKEGKKGGNLSGHCVLFTKFRDREMEEAIIARGGSICSSFSGRTTMVVAKSLEEGKLTGKMAKAAEGGIPIFSADDFKKEFLAEARNESE